MRYKIIGEYGLKIKNFEAATLYEYNIGVRDHYEYKEAMFTNSLFKDFLSNSGLKTWNNESTRDIICLEFNFGTRSYKQEMIHLRNMAEKARMEYIAAYSSSDDYLKKKYYHKRKKILHLAKEAYKNKRNYKQMSKAEVRRLFYNEGITVKYISHKRNGEISNIESIHYKMLYRSTGKAKKGSCMFICDRLYNRALNYLRMGIKLPKHNPMLVEIGAYSPLVSSTIVSKIKINPKNILILKDVERHFHTNVTSIEIDENNHCIAKNIENYKLKNTLFDGQALIDSSIFPSWGNGYILLRHHFCKMAAFSTNIQKFFKDYFGDNYQTATVKDMFGTEHYVKDIELITTDNSMKWLKFNISYDYWCEKVYENNCLFGIVKTAHESKFGDVQRMSYQMVNALDEDIMKHVAEKSVTYVEKLKTDIGTFIDSLKNNANFSNDYEVLVSLYEHNPDFVNSTYFRERKKTIIKSYILNFKSGKVIQNADNLVIVGSPYAMLLYAATGDESSVDNDNTFYVEENTIQCFTGRFNSGEYLAAFRSPFNSKNNLTYLHNVYHKNLEKYFNLGDLCIAVNMISTPFQDRNNGSDQDSDAVYTTNQTDIVEYARQCYLNYPTIVNNIPKDSKQYENTMDDFADIDNNLADAQMAIGESSNLAQLCLTYTYNFENKKYVDYVCILATLAQVAIDSAKRQFVIDLPAEIKRIKKDMNVREKGYPTFWSIIRQGFNKNNINKDLKCPMNYVCNIRLDKFRDPCKVKPMSDFFIKYKLDINRRTCKKVESLIQDYSLKLLDATIDDEECEDSHLLLRSDFDNLISKLRSINITESYLGLMSWLLDRAFAITSDVSRNKKLNTRLNKNRSLLIKILYETSPKTFLKCFTSG